MLRHCNLSQICQLTSEDVKHHFTIIIIIIFASFSAPNRLQALVYDILRQLEERCRKAMLAVSLPRPAQRPAPAPFLSHFCASFATLNFSDVLPRITIIIMAPSSRFPPPPPPPPGFSPSLSNKPIFWFLSGRY